ncbi:hypothetical protein GCM10009629_24190 [Pseudonocardia alni]
MPTGTDNSRRKQRRLVDDGVPPNMVQRILGHERSSTTLGLHPRRTNNSERILQALDDEDDRGTSVAPE